MRRIIKKLVCVLILLCLYLLIEAALIVGLGELHKEYSHTDVQNPTGQEDGVKEWSYP